MRWTCHGVPAAHTCSQPISRRVCSVAMPDSSLCSRKFDALQDKNMETLTSPFGMDAESTQRLVLATAELFRLAQSLKLKQKGLEDALTKRNNTQSRRARFDRMRVRCRYLALFVVSTRQSTRVTTLQHHLVP